MKQRMSETGTLVASGFIAGEAIAGVFIAILFLANAPSLSITFNARTAVWVWLLILALMIYILVRISVRNAQKASMREIEE